jgi:hypothetical protein
MISLFACSARVVDRSCFTLSIEKTVSATDTAVYTATLSNTLPTRIKVMYTGGAAITNLIYFGIYDDTGAQLPIARASIKSTGYIKKNQSVVRTLSLDEFYSGIGHIQAVAEFSYNGNLIVVESDTISL